LHHHVFHPFGFLRRRGYDGDYGYGASVWSKEPLSIVTRNDDLVFSDFVNWVLESLIAAEENKISQDLASPTAIPSTNVFGESFKDMFSNAVGAVGNYGEMYSRHLESLVPRAAVHTVNDGSTGRIYAFPFGGLDKTNGPGPTPGGTLESILRRGYLRCGVSERIIFAQFETSDGKMKGFDVDFCKVCPPMHC
jgi:hypothetical protein